MNSTETPTPVSPEAGNQASAEAMATVAEEAVKTAAEQAPSKRKTGVRAVSDKPATPKRTAAQVRKDAAAAKRERGPVEGGGAVQAKASLSEAEKEAGARKLNTAQKERAAKRSGKRTPKTTTAAAKKVVARKPAKVEFKQRAKGEGGRVYLSDPQYQRLASATDWRKTNAGVWKQVKAGKRVEPGTGRVYYSIPVAAASDADAISAYLTA